VWGRRKRLGRAQVLQQRRDGVILLTSQLRDAAQEQAQMGRGYDETHVSILSNQTVISRVYRNLSQPKQ
jgi:hypothetical protein